MVRRFALSAALLFALALAAATASLGAGCSGKDGLTPSQSAATPDPLKGAPTVRLYLLSTVAGALEPCGCSKDQLGGAKHLAAYMAAQHDTVPGYLLFGAGPLFFQDPVLEGDKKQQDEFKGQALAEAAAAIGVTAWAPGANDWAAGKASFAKLADTSKAAFVGANLKGSDKIVPSKMFEVNGLRVGVVGLSDPTQGVRKPPQDLVVSPPSAEMLQKEVDGLRDNGARVIVVLAAINRGEALRLLDKVKEVSVMVIGKSMDRGDGNDKPKPATMIGDTLVVEQANHLQTVATVDLFVRDNGGPDPIIKFADGGGVQKSEQLLDVSNRIHDLETKINGWEKDKTVDPKDVGARKKDLEDLRAKKSSLEVVDAPPKGSFFKYQSVEVREKLGEDKAVSDVTLQYYKHVNDGNKVAFADRLPEQPEKGKPGYLGVDACSKCHAEERAVWDKTDHAKAYPTLQKEFVEYNLECVGCHVTGYDKPGGSTVVHVEKLENVGCEVCHGPGSLHAKDPKKEGLIDKKPDLKSCVTECHHPPHVENFDPIAKVQNILGPGHGL